MTTSSSVQEGSQLENKQPMHRKMGLFSIQYYIQKPKTKKFLAQSCLLYIVACKETFAKRSRQGLATGWKDATTPTPSGVPQPEQGYHALQQTGVLAFVNPRLCKDRQEVP